MNSYSIIHTIFLKEADDALFLSGIHPFSKLECTDWITWLQVLICPWHFQSIQPYLPFLIFWITETEYLHFYEIFYWIMCKSKFHSIPAQETVEINRKNISSNNIEQFILIFIVTIFHPSAGVVPTYLNETLQNPNWPQCLISWPDSAPLLICLYHSLDELAPPKLKSSL